MSGEDTLGVARDRRIGAEVQGRYRILRKLGEGGMGAVYEGEHLLIRKRVAIKTLHPHLSQNPQAVARFRREAMAATATHNEHIVEVTDMGEFEDDGALFIVLEFLDGRNLADEIGAVGPMPLSRVARIVCQVCEALTVMHAQGIIHRDLKPENLFLQKRADRSDFIKILDFGISKFKSSLDGQPTHLTGDGMMVGTAHFMSPEQAAGSRDVDHRTDIYALGGIIYTMLTAVFAFEAETLPALFIKVATEPPPPVDQRRSDLPREIVDAVSRCLAKRPEERFSSAEEIRRIFAKYRDVELTPVLLPTPVPFVSSGASSKSVDAQVVGSGVPRWLIGGSVAIVLAGALAVLTLGLRGRSQPTPSEAKLAPPPAPVVPVPKHVRIRVWTQPSGAELLLDGQPIPNPFDDQRIASEGQHTLEARLGARTVQKVAVFDRDANLRLDLPEEITPEKEVKATSKPRAVESPRPSPQAEDPAPAPAQIAEPAPQDAPSAPAEPTPSESELLGNRKLKRVKF